MKDQRAPRYYLVALAAFVVAGHVRSANAGDITLSNALWEISASPGTLRMGATPNGKATIELSAAQTGLGRVTDLEQADRAARWKLPDQGLIVAVELDEKDLHVRIRSETERTFTWPVLKQQAPFEALIWPRAEGVYIPLDNTRWMSYLVEHGDWDTLESLSMPFWGFDGGNFMLTYIATCPYNNTIRFSREEDTLRASFTHEFTRFQKPKEYGFVISLGQNNSPVEPAQRFRRWLIENGQFVSMQEKIKTIPRAERLLGAAHVYLWGDGLFTRHDVPARKWRPLCQELIRQAAQPQPSVGKRCKLQMPAERWEQVVQLADTEWPDKYQKTEVAGAISEILARKDFYEPRSWSALALPDEATALLARNRDDLTTAQRCRLNSLLLHAAFANFMKAPDDWGDGVSTKMLERFKDAGFDRLRLCVSGWEGIEKRPDVAKRADEMGYLFGTYDSFHSIHDPALQGTDNTWPTAQFDKELYECGKILRKDGTPVGGFKGVGAKLSPLAARPYVEQRVRRNMANVAYSYYFVDCDAYGEVYDDYSPLHRAGQADDAAARIDRMRWIGETFRVPIGSEGGCFRFAGAIHVSEGIFGPLFGWGDADMRDKNSEYFLGGYYPPDGPRIFTQQVPLKEKYQFLYYDPRFRLPLYEIVFHDSVVTTHHWQNASLKFENVAETVALTELLYVVPPLYHMNLDEFDKHGEEMKRRLERFSPLHRELGFAQMTDFAWLSDDRLLQRTVFDDSVELIANFSKATREYSGLSIPGRSVLGKWKNTGKTTLLRVRPDSLGAEKN